MRRATILAACLSVALAACGSSSPPESATVKTNTTATPATTATSPTPATTAASATPDSPAAGAAAWALRSPTLDPEATEIAIVVTEEACASGSSASGRIVAEVAEFDDRVEIDVGVIALDGPAECPGNPPTPFTIELQAPLGTRTIVGDSDPDRVSNDPPIVRLGMVDPTMPPIVPVSTRDVEGSFSVRPPCEITGEFERYVEAALPGPLDVLAAVVALESYSSEGWHQFREPGGNENSNGSDQFTFVQYLDGSPVRVVTATGATAGWVGRGVGCPDGLGGRTPDAQPPPDGGRDLSGGPTRSPAERLDVRGVVDATPGISFAADDMLVFDDPGAPRCPVWVAFEDRLVDAGYVLGGTLVMADLPDDEAATVQAQHAVSVAERSGAAIGLRTHGNGTVALSATSTVSFGDLADATSAFTPCRLDDQLTVERVG